ncbi:MAG: hypothetical protein KJZ95_09515 [Caldilinea sp.]|nr:hypothetical protein [Caldilinea sp.]
MSWQVYQTLRNLQPFAGRHLLQMPTFPGKAGDVFIGYAQPPSVGKT